MSALIHSLLQTNPMAGFFLSAVLLTGIAVGFLGGIVLF